MTFKDKVVWITGAGTGIGKALALELAEHKATVVLSGRRREKLESVLAELKSVGCVIPCDVTVDAELAECVEQILTRYGRLDLVIANAGFSVGGRIEDLNTEDWKKQLYISLCVKVDYEQTIRHHKGIANCQSLRHREA